MKFLTSGNRDNPVIIMLAGSFCPAESMKNIYTMLTDDFYIISPTYNGHYDGSKAFTSRQGEAAEIADYLKVNGIDSVRMIYGQSMGAEIGMELLSRLNKDGISVDSAFFDGGPFIKLSKAYKAFMLLKFRSLIKMVKNKTVDDIMSIGIIKKFSNGDPASLRPMLEDMKSISLYLSDETIKNENECCYTFDFPEMSREMQKRMYFFYAEDEKAYKTCFKGVKKAYSYADYRVVKGYGHLTYAMKHTDEYVEELRKIADKAAR